MVTLLLALALRKPNPTAKHFFQLQTLQSENTNLRRQATTNIYQVQGGSEYPDPSSNSSLKRRPSARGSRPMSMYETGSGQKPYLPMGEVTYPEENITRLQPFPPHVSKTAAASALPLTFSFSASSDAARSLSFCLRGEKKPGGDKNCENCSCLLY